MLFWSSCSYPGLILENIENNTDIDGGDGDDDDERILNP